MANPKHLAMLKRGVDKWNKWRSEHPDIFPDLVSANLVGENLAMADLAGANLAEADLTGADLTQAVVSFANLFVADLTGANLLGANVSWAYFGQANVSQADFGQTVLFATNFRQATLSQTDFSKATFSSTQFDDVDLSVAKGLETVDHAGPSTVGTDTIYKSKGKIPEAFLRGCGVPEEIIELARSIASNLTEYYSCFISYSTKDQEFADLLYADLQTKGVRCWFAPHDMKPGDKIYRQIDQAIRVYDKLLLILSEHSMASDWVGTEIANAREREAREKKQMLFPITIAPFEDVKQWKLFDADRGKDSAREIREYYIPNFSGWERDHGVYQMKFEKLVGALKASGTP